MPSPRDRQQRDLHKERIADSLRADLKPSRRPPSRARSAKAPVARAPEALVVEQSWLRRWFLRLFWSGAAASTAVLAFLLVLYAQQPPVAELREVRLSQPLQILSSDGKLISQIGTIKRQPIDYQEIPSHLIYALLAAEDSRFFDHFGVDILGLARAVKELLLFEQRQSGGSTITMQVARNYYLTRKQTLWRKLNEILLALKIERALSKEEILELYVNKIFLGFRSYGFAAAARSYYNKDLAELNLAQLSMLAALPKAPSALNPAANPQRARVRRDWILQRMGELQYVDLETMQQALDSELSARPYDQSTDVEASYAAEMARLRVLEDPARFFGREVSTDELYTTGYKIYTTIDTEHQQVANTAVINGVLAYEQRHGFRGAEKHYPELALPEAFFAENPDLQAALREIERMTSYGVLEPVIVSAVGEQELQVMDAFGDVHDLNWEAISWARPYISVNDLGPKPETAADIARVGDLLRVYKTEMEGNWTLGQVPSVEAALVAINPTDGDIVSLVGGFHFKRSEFNRAINAKRQLGSTLKPFIYTSAFAQGRNGATIVNDAPLVTDLESNDIWRPRNSNYKFEGPTVLRQGLYRSRNLISIRLLNSISMDETIATMQEFGFEEQQLPKDLSLALGSSYAAPVQVARAFAVFANGGQLIEPYIIDRITTVEDELIYQALPVRACEAEADDSCLYPAPRVIDPDTHYMVHSILQDVIKKGTGRRAQALGRSDIAGKTGTTNDTIDAWFSGYNRELVAVSWVGFDSPSTLGNSEYGSVAALPIWREFMQSALAEVATADFEPPPTLSKLWIDSKTGKITTDNNPNAYQEYLRASDVTNTPIDFDQNQYLSETPSSSANASEQVNLLDLLESSSSSAQSPSVGSSASVVTDIERPEDIF